MPFPQITGGVAFLQNDGIDQINNTLGGALTNIGYKRDYGFDYTLTATKAFPKVFDRTLLLTAVCASARRTSSVTSASRMNITPHSKATSPTRSHRGCGSRVNIARRTAITAASPDWSNRKTIGGRLVSVSSRANTSA